MPEFSFFRKFGVPDIALIFFLFTPQQVNWAALRRKELFNHLVWIIVSILFVYIGSSVVVVPVAMLMLLMNGVTLLAVFRMSPEQFQQYALAQGLPTNTGGLFNISSFLRFRFAGHRRAPYGGLSPAHFWLSMTDRDFNDGGMYDNPMRRIMFVLIICLYPDYETLLALDEMNVPKSAASLEQISLLPAEVYGQIPKIVEHNTDGTDKPTQSSACSICLCDFEEGDNLRVLPLCYHRYHSSAFPFYLEVYYKV
jgi:hypothetical protein